MFGVAGEKTQLITYWLWLWFRSHPHAHESTAPKVINLNGGSRDLISCIRTCPRSPENSSYHASPWPSRANHEVRKMFIPQSVWPTDGQHNSWRHAVRLGVQPKEKWKARTRADQNCSPWRWDSSGWILCTSLQREKNKTKHHFQACWWNILQEEQSSMWFIVNEPILNEINPPDFYYCYSNLLGF